MSVLIRVGIRKAILRAGRWISADLALERQLNETTSQWIKETGGPRLDDGEPEKTVAQEMVNRYKGHLLVYLKSRSRVSSESFVRQRQLEFTFDAFLEIPAKTPKVRAPRSRATAPSRNEEKPSTGKSARQRAR